MDVLTALIPGIVQGITEWLPVSSSAHLVIVQHILNVDENPGVSQQFGIRSIPTILLFKNGRLADTIVGAAPREQIEARLNALLG